MRDLSGYVLETLRDDGEFILYRGRRSGNPGEALPQVLVLAPVATPPAPAALERLEHEYALAAELDPAWAARPLALVRHDQRTMLVLEDWGGEPIDRALGRCGNLTATLRAAIALADALGQVHQRGLIHKDIKPANVLLDAAGQVRLTGFGIASRLPRERQDPGPPEIIAGTLAYMAPEQTGRMNRSIDARSDLYALGVTLYELLTKTLPFAADDPLEWIHCHIARRPTPPAERAPDVPAPLSTIVMKLLAKTAEERYQTAAGVAADLRRCLIQLESTGRIDPFTPGAHDASDRLLVPETLYGREREIDALLAAFEQVAAAGTPGLALVSGPAGIGKSSVVYELHKALVPRGLFAAGKFDRYQRDIPYVTIGRAFPTLIRQILSKSEAELRSWRDALRLALEPDGQLIVNLIPALELVIGPQQPVPHLSARASQHRFQAVLQRFLSVFARPEHPLALFLDDLQWLDAATLDLIERLLTGPETGSCLLIGAYRDNEVGPSHPLVRTLAAIRATGARVHEVVLAPLRTADLTHLVADALHCNRARAAPLARLVREKTGGNPFFASQFLTALDDEGLIAFDRDAIAWTWDLAGIRARRVTDNVVDLLVGKLTRLPGDTQDALQRLACLGSHAPTATLVAAAETSQEVVHGALWEAVRAGLVFPLEGGYTFLHDRVQEAAYATIPEQARATRHLQIGRRLAADLPDPQREEAIFEIANQFNRGAALIPSAAEREQVATLNLTVGRRARAATAYGSALNYFAAGAALLTAADGTRHDPLTFALEFHRAECEFLTGDLATADDRLSTLSRRAAPPVDRAAVTRLRVVLYTALDRPDRAIDVGLDYLRDAGIEWPPHPTAEALREEFVRIWQQLGIRPIEALIDLPLMRDAHWRVVMDVLMEMVTPAVSTDAHLVGLIVGRMTNLSLEHGNSDASCFAYVHLAMELGAHFGDYRAGFRFGTLALDLVDTRGLDGFKARVYKQFGAHVMPWTQHIRAGRALVRHAFDTALAAGDLTFAAYSCNAMTTIMLASGDPLSDVERGVDHGLAVARSVGLGRVIDILTTQRGLVRTLRGVTPHFGTFDEPDFDEPRFAERLDEDQRLVLPACWHWIRKLQAGVLAGDYASALDAAGKAQPRLWVTAPFFEVAEYHFYAALARAAACDATSADARPAHLEALLAHSRQLTAWATAGPETFGTRVALVDAEIARLDGRELEAMRLYEAAIQLAHAHGFLELEALAHEVASRYYAGRGFQTIAGAYLQQSRSCYLRWGADGKVRQLDALYPDLHADPSPLAPPTTIGAPVEQLDVTTVVKASQAVSGEIVLGTLIETLIRLAVEHAGADRGLLILLRNNEPQIAAEATTGSSGIVVALRDAAVTPRDLPQSALHYGLRTMEPVQWDDGSGGHDLSEDEYVSRQRPRSVLCLPIVKQNTLLGALYLENSLTPRVFTAGRIALLELLAAQAAISLENARLYGDLGRNESSLADLAGRLIHAQEEERRRIGRELHDHISQRLALLALRLDQAAAAALCTSPDAVSAGFAERAQDTREIAGEIHRLSHRLHSTMLDHMGLVPALTRLVAEFSERHHLSIDLAPGPLPADVSPDVSLCLFRIVEEALTNVAKHSGAQSVRVSVVEALAGVRVTVADDGAGFDPEVLNRAAGLGLMSMRERVRLVHGTLNIESAASQGTRIDAWAPAAGTDASRPMS